MATNKKLVFGLLSILLFVGLVFYLNILAPKENDAYNKEIKPATTSKISYSDVTKKYLTSSTSFKKGKLSEPSKMVENFRTTSVLRKFPGTSGITEKDIATLHERQMRAIAERLQDPDEIVLPPSEDGQPGITRGELEAIHERQMRAIAERLQDPDEIAVPSSEDGQPGITRSELEAIHERQMRAIAKRLQNLDEIAVPSSEDEQPGLTRSQLLDLHDRQIENMDLDNKF